MSFIASRDFFFDVAQGKVAGHNAIIMVGRNYDIDTAAEEDVWASGGTLSFLTSTDRAVLLSTYSSDTTTGTGARTVRVTYLDANWARQTEDVSMNGTTGVSTTATMRRVEKLQVLTAGTAETNRGTITAQAALGENSLNSIPSNVGASRNSHYTVPSGTISYITRVEFGTHKDGAGTTPEVEFKGLVRPFGGAWFEAFSQKFDTDVVQFITVEQPIMPALPAKTDLKLAANTSINDTNAATRMFIIEVATTV